MEAFGLNTLQTIFHNVCAAQLINDNYWYIFHFIFLQTLKFTYKLLFYRCAELAVVAPGQCGTLVSELLVLLTKFVLLKFTFKENQLPVCLCTVGERGSAAKNFYLKTLSRLNSFIIVCSVVGSLVVVSFSFVVSLINWNCNFHCRCKYIMDEERLGSKTKAYVSGFATPFKILLNSSCMLLCLDHVWLMIILAVLPFYSRQTF